MKNLNEIIREEIESFIEFDSRKIKAVIFDFDFTLVDTTCYTPLGPYAKAHRDWSAYDKYMPQTRVYAGVKELIQYLMDRNILVLVVTNSKQSVAQKTLDYHGIKYNGIRGAQGPRMPKKLRMLALLRKGNISPDEAISVGDLPTDEVQSNAAGIKFVGCTWGNDMVNGINNPLDLIKIIEEYEEN